MNISKVALGAVISICIVFSAWYIDHQRLSEKIVKLNLKLDEIILVLPPNENNNESNVLLDKTVDKNILPYTSKAEAKNLDPASQAYEELMNSSKKDVPEESVNPNYLPDSNYVYFDDLSNEEKDYSWSYKAESQFYDIISNDKDWGLNILENIECRMSHCKIVIQTHRENDLEFAFHVSSVINIKGLTAKKNGMTWYTDPSTGKLIFYTARADNGLDKLKARE